MAFKHILFSKNFRQRDAALQRALEKIRNGNIDAQVLSLLNSRVCAAHNDEKMLVLTATRALADQLNNRHLAGIAGEAVVYKASFWHKNSNFDYSIYRAPQQLILKIGARVMLVANNLPYWANGMLGTVLQLEQEAITLQLDGHDDAIIIKRKVWDDTRYDDEGNKQLLLGEYTQFPLMLGKAVTIHKAQGISVDALYLDMRASLFAAGQLYVALSRCRTLAGLQLSRALTRADFLSPCQR